MSYQTFPEFMHNDDVSGFWILNKPQMYGAIVASALLLVITSTFLSLAPRVAVSLGLGMAIGFFAGSKIRGISGYLYALYAIKYYIRLFLLRDTVIYAASLTYESSVEKQDGGRVVVDSTQTSLPRIQRRSS